MEGQKIVFYEEGSYGYVAVTEEGFQGMIKRLFINGQGSSSLRPADVRVSTLLGYLPILINPDASSSLVIGFGTGATSNILSRHTKTTTVEIEPKVIKIAGYFKIINEWVFNENHKIVYNDARDYIKKSRERYDIVVNHPLDPHQSFSSLLFTREFFEIVCSKLSDDGLYVQWFPAYGINPEEFKDFYYTFDSIFPYQLVFVSMKGDESIKYTIKGERIFHLVYRAEKDHSELIIIGSARPIHFDINALRNNFNLLTEYDRSYLGLTGLDFPDRIYNLLFFRGEDIDGYYEGSNLITDDKPILEFSTPLNLIKKENESSAGDDVLNYLRSAKGEKNYGWGR